MDRPRSYENKLIARAIGYGIGTGRTVTFIGATYSDTHHLVAQYVNDCRRLGYFVDHVGVLDMDAGGLLRAIGDHESFGYFLSSAAKAVLDGEPVNDPAPAPGTFEWALGQMRVGKKVRRKGYDSAYCIGSRYCHECKRDHDRVMLVLPDGKAIDPPYGFPFERLLATDWEIAE